jgi:hypothetical protein
MVSWHHPKCFNLPKRLSSVSHAVVVVSTTSFVRLSALLTSNCCFQGAEKITPADFVGTMLKDSSGEILPAKADKIAKDIGTKVVVKKEPSPSILDQTRDAHLARQNEDMVSMKRQREEKELASKKLKSADAGHQLDGQNEENK